MRMDHHHTAAAKRALQPHAAIVCQASRLELEWCVYAVGASGTSLVGSLSSMNATVQAILDLLRVVDEQRALRALDAVLEERVRAVKHYQHARFKHAYADLLATPRYANAALFFLEELYGPNDFSKRDAQFKRVVPALVRLFPHELVVTVQTLGELHALSETLDTAMGRAIPSTAVDLASYAVAWQSVGRPADRENQIMLMRRVGDALDGYTRNPLLRHSLRLMRGPARVAGLPELQKFLESGFDTFREMRGAKEFLDTVVQREREIAAFLFSAAARDPSALSDPRCAARLFPPQAAP
jgi:hypothetical protein